MRSILKESEHLLNILIYAQSGVLAGDLAALLAGHHQVGIQTNPSGLLKTLTSATDVLLLVMDIPPSEPLDPLVILAAAGRAHCKVILVGNRQGAIWEKCNNRVIFLPEIPSPSVLLKVVESAKPIKSRPAFP